MPKAEYSDMDKTMQNRTVIQAVMEGTQRIRYLWINNKVNSHIDCKIREKR